MRNRLRLAGLVTGIVLGASVISASAAPIRGGFSITGNFLPVVGATGASTTLGLATGLDFINFFGSAATPGVAGTVFVNSGSEDFAGLVGGAGTMRDFTFSGPGSAAYPTPALMSFQAFPSGALTFDLLSAAVLFQTSNVLAFTGSGIFHMAGFQDTFGTLTFTGNGASSTFSFSASQNATAAVPEPASLVVFAAALLAGAGYMRRRMPRV